MGRVDELLAQAKASGSAQPSRVDRLLAIAKSEAPADAAPESWLDKIKGFTRGTADMARLLGSGLSKAVADQFSPLPPGGSYVENQLTDQEKAVARAAVTTGLVTQATAPLAPVVSGAAGALGLAGLNVASDSAIRGLTAYGEGQPVGEAMNPLNHPWATAFDMAVPLGAEGISSALASRRAAADATRAARLQQLEEAAAATRAAAEQRAAAEAVAQAPSKAATDLSQIIGRGFGPEVGPPTMEQFALNSAPEGMSDFYAMTRSPGMQPNPLLTPQELDPFNRTPVLSRPATSLGGTRSGVTVRRQPPDLFADIGNNLPERAPMIDNPMPVDPPELTVDLARQLQQAADAVTLAKTNPEEFYGGSLDLAQFLSNDGRLPGVTPPMAPPEIPIPPAAPPVRGDRLTLERLGMVGRESPIALSEADRALAQSRIQQVIDSVGTESTGFTEPLRVIAGSNDPAAQMFAGAAGRMLPHQRRISEAFGRRIENIYGPLSVEQRLAVRTAIENGAVDQLPVELQAAARGVQDLSDDARNMLSSANVQTRRGGRLEEFAPVGSKARPEDLSSWHPTRYDLSAVEDLDALEKQILAGNMSYEEAIAQSINPRMGAGRMVQHERTATDIPLERLDPLEEWYRYSNDVGRQIAQRRMMGRIGQGGVGEDALTAVAAIQDPRAQSIARDMLFDYYKTPRDPVAQKLLPWISRTSQVFGSHIGFRQPGEWWKPGAMFGVRNIGRGRAMRAADSTLDDMLALSGAGESGQSGFLEAGLGMEHSALPVKITRNVERYGREEIAQVAGAAKLMQLADDVGAGRISRATEWQLGEMGTSAAEIARELEKGGGSLDLSIPSTRSLVMDASQAASDATLLQADITTMPRWARGGLGKALFQYKTFGLLQGQMMKRMLADVAREAVREGDSSLARLALSRAGKSAALGIPAQAADSVVYQLLAGRLPHLPAVVRDTAGGIGGLPGDVARDSLGYALGAVPGKKKNREDMLGTLMQAVPPSRDNPLDNLLSIPAARLLTAPVDAAANASRDFGEGDYDAGTATLIASLLPYVAAAADSSGRASLAARFLSGATDEYRKRVEGTK